MHMKDLNRGEASTKSNKLKDYYLLMKFTLSFSARGVMERFLHAGNNRVAPRKKDIHRVQRREDVDGGGLRIADFTAEAKGGAS